MSPRGRAGLPVIALLAAALGLSACFGPPPPPPPPPPSGPCLSALSADQNPASPPPASPVPVSPGQAEELAASAVAASTTRDAEGQIPLVTVEQTPNGPEIISTPVASADEAADVAAARAADGALLAVDVDSPVTAATPSNDTFRNQQWALDKVAFEQAWVDDGVNGSGVKVAVVDTGVLQSHPDLAGQVLQGREFLGSTHQNVPGGTTDGYGHGTHVAGIIGALAGNAAGITGAAPGVKILPVKVLCPNGKGSSADVAAGVIWAVNDGAKVVNLSLGGPFSTAVRNAVAHAQTNHVTVVAAAGNCGQGASPCSAVNEPTYPGALSQAVHGVEAIAVAATTNSNGHALYSTIATYVDISAPGGAGGNNNNPVTAVLSTWNDGQFRAISGTSMATPHVAAAAALLVQKGCTATEVRARLLSTADPLGGTPQQFGAGLVDPVEAASSCT